MNKKPKQHDLLEQICSEVDCVQPTIPQANEVLDFAEKALNPKIVEQRVVPHEDTVDMDKILERARRQVQELTYGNEGCCDAEK